MDKTIPFDIRRNAEDFCLECGFPIKNLGFESAATAIALCVQNERLMRDVKNDLYHAVAAAADRSFSYSGFRKSIDAAIAYAADHLCENKISRHFTNISSGNIPTVKQFIFTGVRYVRNHVNHAC